MNNQDIKLFKIVQELSSNEIEDLYFLCNDILQPSKVKKKDGMHLISELEKLHLISHENTGLIEELLSYIKRNDLLKLLFNVENKEHGTVNRPGPGIISSYRKLLYDLGNLVSDNELKKKKCLFSDKLSKPTLENVISLLDIFMELEKNDNLNKNNLTYLKEISKNFHEDFINYISKYEKQEIELETRNCHFQGDTTSVNDHSKTDQFYEMKSEPLGICLIINNFDFKDSNTCMKDRHGTDFDKESLRSVFLKLNFEVHIKNDLTGEKILRTMQSYKDMNHEKMDCFVCCLLSHGNEGTIYGIDGEIVCIKDITSSFCRTLCPSLQGKPKLFFIQACQGNDHHTPVYNVIDACNASISNVLEEELIPNEPDFLLGMATTLHHVSYRDASSGSWYIQSLCKNLQGYHRDEDIISILTKVNHDLSQKDALKFNGKQMPQPSSTLRKKLKFPLLKQQNGFTS